MSPITAAGPLAGRGTASIGADDTVVPVLDTDEFDRWRRAAANARLAAGHSAAAGIHSWACFLAEQATQLAVKGFLHGVGAGGWGHDLVDLGERLADTIGRPLDTALTDGFARLSRHYIPARYPDAHPGGAPEDHYTPADSEQALADADLVLSTIERLWAEAHA